jgi:salicylate hydroxylase
MDRHSPDVARAFVAFQNTRLLRATRVQMTARFFEHFWHPKDIGADLRNAYLASHAPDDYAEFDWLYGTRGDGQPRSGSNPLVFSDETWATPI